MANLSTPRERRDETREELHVSAHPSSPELGVGLGRAGLGLGKGRAGLGLRNIQREINEGEVLTNVMGIQIKREGSVKNASLDSVQCQP